MSARTGLLERAVAWLIAPAEDPAPRGPARAPDDPKASPGRPAARAAADDPGEGAATAAALRRPVIVVCGAGAGAGATTIARALAAALASRDPFRSAVVAGADARGALPLATPAAARLARVVRERAGVAARPSGRLCLARADDPPALAGALRGAAPLVVDAGGREQARRLATLADRVVVVAAARSEPALAEIVARSLAGEGARPLVVVNRLPPIEDDPGGRWAGRSDVAVPASLPAARLALACRGGTGAFGAAVDALAQRCLEP